MGGCLADSLDMHRNIHVLTNHNHALLFFECIVNSFLMLPMLESLGRVSNCAYDHMDSLKLVKVQPCSHK